MKYSAFLLIFAALLTSTQAISQVITVTPGSAASFVFKPAKTAASALYWNFTLDLSSITTAANASKYSQPTFLASTWTGIGVIAAGTPSTFTGVVYKRACGVAAATPGTPSQSTCGSFPAVYYSSCTTSFDATSSNWGKGIGPCVYYFGAPNSAQNNYFYLEVVDLPVANVSSGQ